MPILIQGKVVAEQVYSQLLLEVSLLPFVPKIAVVLIGEDPASQTYVKMKTKKCSDLGLRSDTIVMPKETTEAELLAKIASLNKDPDTHGILVQLPLPASHDKFRVACAVDPLKDVDGLHPENVGRLVQAQPRFVPCTPMGVIELLKYYSLPLESKKVVIVGRSEIVGKPMAHLALHQNATVTLCHSKTHNLAKELSEADVLIAAMGKKHFVNGDMVKPGAVVIDVGIHRAPEGITGDVDFASVESKVSAITPVPGGVGPMTIALLMKNLILAATLQAKKQG